MDSRERLPSVATIIVAAAIGGIGVIYLLNRERGRKSNTEKEISLRITRADAEALQREQRQQQQHIGGRMTKEDAKVLRQQLTCKALSVSYGNTAPLMLEGARQQFMWELEGEEPRVYLDTRNNVCHIGHCHPAVIKAVADQVNTQGGEVLFLFSNVFDLLGNVFSETCYLFDVLIKTCYFLNSKCFLGSSRSPFPSPKKSCNLLHFLGNLKENDAVTLNFFLL